MLRYRLDDPLDRRVQIERNLRKTTRSTFFWFHACDIAEQHGIALEDLRLGMSFQIWRHLESSRAAVETVAHCWGVKTTGRAMQHRSALSNEIYH